MILYNTARNSKKQKDEINVLLKRKTFIKPYEKDSPAGPKILGGIFVLASKHVRAPDEMHGARSVVRGYVDRDRNMLVHGTANIQQQTIRIIVSIDSLMNYRLWTQDVAHAYFQGTRTLSRDVYKQLKQGFNLKLGEPLNHIKPLYGLIDSEDYWHETMQHHLWQDLKMKQATKYLACFSKVNNRKLSR